jgi:AcrR family transcriptional regulator
VAEGDESRRLERLWCSDQSATRGPKPRLDLDRIVRAATSIADVEGLGPLSMRKVAELLEVGTMSLYTYVPGKTELLDLMLDQAVAGANELGAGTWRERVERIAHEDWWRYHRHPWLLEIAPLRPVMGPNALARREHELAALDGIGLNDFELDAVVNLLAGHVERAARRALDASARTPVLEGLVDPERFPTAMRVGAATHEDNAAEHSFEFGLHRILDSVQSLVDGRSSAG